MPVDFCRPLVGLVCASRSARSAVASVPVNGLLGGTVRRGLATIELQGSTVTQRDARGGLRQRRGVHHNAEVSMLLVLYINVPSSSFSFVY